MADFTRSDMEKMSSWLRGSKDYITKVSIVARWSTKIPGTSYDTVTGLSPIADPEEDLNILETGQESEEQEIEDIFDVRLKRSGLSHDLKFRASSLNFTWPNYAQFKQGKSERAIRFYLKVSLVDSSGDELNLLKTDWYKIKSTEEIYSTSKSSGADVRIEAIPWIYEYNERTKEGNDARAWIEGNFTAVSGGGALFGGYGGYDPEWFNSEEGSVDSVRRETLAGLLGSESIMSIGRLKTTSNELYVFLSNGMEVPTGVHSEKRVTSWNAVRGQNVTVTYEDGTTDSFPCTMFPSTIEGGGVDYVYNLDGGKWDRPGPNTGSNSYTNTPMSYRCSFNGVSRVQKILHDRKVGDLQDSPCSYTGPFVFSVSYNESATAVNARQNMGRMNLVGSCNETALSYLSWWALTEGGVIRPRSYIKDERVLDTPLVDFYRVSFSLLHSDEDLFRFDSVENSDQAIVFESKYKYEVTRYEVAVPVYDYRQTRNVRQKVSEDAEGNVTYGFVEVEVDPYYTNWCMSTCILDAGDSAFSGWIEADLAFKDSHDYDTAQDSGSTSQRSISGVVSIIDSGYSAVDFYSNLNWMSGKNFDYFISEDWVSKRKSSGSVEGSGITQDLEVIGLGFPTRPINFYITGDSPTNFKVSSIRPASATVSMSYDANTKILNCIAYGRSNRLTITFTISYDYLGDYEVQSVESLLITSTYLSVNSYKEIIGTEGSVVPVDTHGVWDSSATNYLKEYAALKEGIKFNAEWRPWLKIYSKIEVKAMNSFGENYNVLAMITSIDANADTMSATYKGIVLEKEAV